MCQISTFYPGGTSFYLKRKNQFCFHFGHFNRAGGGGVKGPLKGKTAKYREGKSGVCK